MYKITEPCSHYNLTHHLDFVEGVKFLDIQDPASSALATAFMMANEVAPLILARE